MFVFDDTNLGAELTTAPYTISWNTSTTTNGPHALTAAARDAAGNITISSGISVTVAKLIVSITAPLNGARLTILTKVTVQATSAVGVSTVQVYDDKILIGAVSCIDNPCLSLKSTVDWPTNNLAVGPHVLQAVGIDNFGNSMSGTPITVFK